MSLFVVMHQNTKYFVVAINPLQQSLDNGEGQSTSYLSSEQIVCKCLDLSNLKQSFQFVRNYSHARESTSCLLKLFVSFHYLCRYNLNFQRCST